MAVAHVLPPRGGEAYGATTMRCTVVFLGGDLQVSPSVRDVTFTGLDFTGDNEAQRVAKIAAIVRTESATIINSGGTQGVTVAANQVQVFGNTKA